MVRIETIFSMILIRVKDNYIYIIQLYIYIYIKGYTKGLFVWKIIITYTIKCMLLGISSNIYLRFSYTTYIFLHIIMKRMKENCVYQKIYKEKVVLLSSLRHVETVYIRIIHSSYFNINSWKCFITQ